MGPSLRPSTPNYNDYSSITPEYHDEYSTNSPQYRDEYSTSTPEYGDEFSSNAPEYRDEFSSNAPDRYSTTAATSIPEAEFRFSSSSPYYEQEGSDPPSARQTRTRFPSFFSDSPFHTAGSTFYSSWPDPEAAFLAQYSTTPGPVRQEDTLEYTNTGNSDYASTSSRRPVSNQPQLNLLSDSLSVNVESKTSVGGTVLSTPDSQYTATSSSGVDIPKNWILIAKDPAMLQEFLKSSAEYSTSQPATSQEPTTPYPTPSVSSEPIASAVQSSTYDSTPEIVTASPSKVDDLQQLIASSAQDYNAASFQPSAEMNDQSFLPLGSVTGNYGSVQNIQPAQTPVKQTYTGFSPSQLIPGYVGSVSTQTPTIRTPVQTYSSPIQSIFSSSITSTFNAPQSIITSYGAPANGYGAPAKGYGAPAKGYGAPAKGYGAPAKGYGAPAKGYGTPAKGYGTPSKGYGAPGKGYGAPANGYGAPANGYGAPTNGYGVPSQTYGAPTQSYSVPKPAKKHIFPKLKGLLSTKGYGTAKPTKGYGSPKPTKGYGVPKAAKGYGAPKAAKGYGVPQPTAGYGAPKPTNGYGVPKAAKGYGAPKATKGYGVPQPTSGYGAPRPTKGYGAPNAAKGYGVPQPTGGYGAPTTGYSVSRPTAGYSTPASNYNVPAAGYYRPQNPVEHFRINPVSQGSPIKLQLVGTSGRSHAILGTNQPPLISTQKPVWSQPFVQPVQQLPAQSFIYGPTTRFDYDIRPTTSAPSEPFRSAEAVSFTFDSIPFRPSNLMTVTSSSSDVPLPGEYRQGRSQQSSEAFHEYPVPRADSVQPTVDQMSFVVQPNFPYNS